VTHITWECWELTRQPYGLIAICLRQSFRVKTMLLNWAIIKCQNPKHRSSCTSKLLLYFHKHLHIWGHSTSITFTVSLSRRRTTHCNQFTLTAWVVAGQHNFSCWWPNIKYYCDELWGKHSIWQLSAGLLHCVMRFILTLQRNVLPPSSEWLNWYKWMHNWCRGRISVDYLGGFDRIWLITNMEDKEMIGLALLLSQ
jgi:hypothetical protein